MRKLLWNALDTWVNRIIGVQVACLIIVWASYLYVNGPVSPLAQSEVKSDLRSIQLQLAQNTKRGDDHDSLGTR